VFDWLERSGLKIAKPFRVLQLDEFSCLSVGNLQLAHDSGKREVKLYACTDESLWRWGTWGLVRLRSKVLRG
jgi:hypothetical protein